ncbi:hypothetical protein O185_11805 [Photorhabdus temperata J3]|uniref:Uncharacterized protein n=1 Tax=Photorhabdus temperata J3 TaxID=1389415 RepID=U7QXY7_PHOTE|nr:hypothetical protein O185_11805 [Photorhabdus temperata J3]
MQVLHSVICVLQSRSSPGDTEFSLSGSGTLHLIAPKDGL